MKPSAKKKKERGYSFRLRAGLVMLGLAAAAGLILVRAFDLQVLQAARLSDLAAQEYYQTITLLPSRGVIYDRHLVELAVSVQVDSVYARPGLIVHKGQTAAKLARALKMNKGEVLQSLNKKAPFVWIKRQVEPDLAAQVAALKLDGVGIFPEGRRYYPHKELAAHLLGFAGLDARGLEGLEKGYDKLLRGPVTRLTRMRDGLGRPIYDEGLDAAEIPSGHELVLTLDKRIQYLTERALARAVTKYRAKGGMAVVLNPATGEVYAAALLPTFNPNVYGRYKPYLRRNRSVTDTFEPGSSFKIFTLAAALEEGLVSPATEIDCENGAWPVGGRVVHDVHPYERLTVSQVLVRSSNIGAAKLGLALKAKRLHAHIARFGFGSPTGLDLPGESGGLLRPPGRWRTIDTASASFGQGINVTIWQLASAVGAVANEGLLMRPFVVREIRQADHRLVKRIGPLARGQAVSAQTAHRLVRMMEKVTAEGGTGTRARTPGYRVAGKTGTAQKIDPASRAYSQKDFYAIFVGFAPVIEPAIVIAVIVDEPRGSIYGGVVAAPVFAEIAGQALPLLGVPPSRPQNLRAALEDSGPAERPAPLPAFTEDEIVRAAGSRKMPRLLGLSLRQALAVVSRLGLQIQVQGSGYVFEQDPPAGQGLDQVETCRLKLRAGA